MRLCNRDNNDVAFDSARQFENFPHDPEHNFPLVTVQKNLLRIYDQEFENSIVRHLKYIDEGFTFMPLTTREHCVMVLFYCHENAVWFYIVDYNINSAKSDRENMKKIKDIVQQYFQSRIASKKSCRMGCGCVRVEF